MIAFAEKAQVVNRRVCKVDDASPGLTHILTSFVHVEPFRKEEGLRLHPQPQLADISAKARELWHLGLEHHNPQVLEENLATYQDENDAARDCRTLLVARTESVPHGDSHHREGERRHADDRYRNYDVHA